MLNSKGRLAPVHISGKEFLNIQVRHAAKPENVLASRKKRKAIETSNYSVNLFPGAGFRKEFSCTGFGIVFFRSSCAFVREAFCYIPHRPPAFF